jgi:HlyD family secretion protein
MCKLSIFSAFVVSIGAGAGWVYLPATSPAPHGTSRVAPDAAAHARVIRGTAYVEPATELRPLTFRTDGVIGKCRVEVGQVVRRGEVLMALVNDEQRAVVGVAEQELGVAVAQREKVLSGAHQYQILAVQKKCELLAEQAKRDKKHHERVANLFKTKVSTQDEFERSQSDWRQSELNVCQVQAELTQLRKIVRPEDRVLVEAQVALAKSRLESEKQRLANTMLVAPFDGTVLEILKREGEGAQNLDPVIVFGDESQLRVRAEIDERYVHELQIGQTATVHGVGLGSDRVTGRVVMVKRIMGKKTVFTREPTERKDLDVLQVLIELPTDFRAPMGLQVDVDLDVDTTDNDAA